MTTANFTAWFDWMEKAFEGQPLHTRRRHGLRMDTAALRRRTKLKQSGTLFQQQH